MLLGRPAEELIGKPLALLVGKPDMEPLRQFLEKPARFAETARPSIALGSEDGNADLLLFAEGQAGVVTGYFGFLRRRTRIAPAPAAGTDSEIEPGMLGRLSRGIRGPLNTIIGFADLIRAASAGHPGQERHAEYARDIRTAGLEIAVLADELDDFTRLRDGRYAPRPADVELGPLLDSCMLRVRSQAAGARVLVRSAISERLPRVRADRATARVVATELASAQATARLLAVLPLAVLLLGNGLGGDPVGFLLGTPAGLVCLAAGLSLEYAGLVWLGRIADRVSGRVSGRSSGRRSR